MNYLKKLLLMTFVIFARVESSSVSTQKKLKPKIQKTNKKIAKEIRQIFATDDKNQIAKEVNDVELFAQTPEQKQEVAKALQKEISKQNKEIKQELSKANQGTLEYITYMQALDIIKSKKELSDIKSSSWTNSYIIKPLTKTYRLFLRVWDQKKHAELLEQERKSLEHALNVQAHNNIMLLYVALDLATKQQDLNIEHMFKKENFYKTIIHAFEGGALFASDIQLSNKVNDLITKLNMLITQNFQKISTNKAIVQSIWQMNEIFEQLDTQKKPIQTKLRIKKDFKYESLLIKELCVNAANKNGQILVDSKESYVQYLQKWISQPKNVAKVGFAIAAIGGLYIYGPAAPAWLKEYSTSSIGSIKGAVLKGYNATISSVKNLWNKLSGNKTQKLPDFREARMDAQQQGLDIDDYFIKQGSEDAQEIERKDIEFKENLKDLESQVSLERAFGFTDENYDQIQEADRYEREWEKYSNDLQEQKDLELQEQKRKDIENRLDITNNQLDQVFAFIEDKHDQINQAHKYDLEWEKYSNELQEQKDSELKKQERIEREILKEYQRSAKKTDDFDQEIDADSIIQKDAEIIKDLIERDGTQTEPEYETAGKIRFNPTSGQLPNLNIESNDQKDIAKKIPSEYLTSIINQTGFDKYDIEINVQDSPQEALQIANAQIDLLNNEFKNQTIISYDKSYENKKGKEYWNQIKKQAEQRLAQNKSITPKHTLKNIPSEYLTTIIKPTKQKIGIDVHEEPEKILHIANTQLDLLDKQFKDQKSSLIPILDAYSNEKNKRYWNHQKQVAEKEIKKTWNLKKNGTTRINNSIKAQ